MSANDFWQGRTGHLIHANKDQTVFNLYTHAIDGAFELVDGVGALFLGGVFLALFMSIAFGIYTYLLPILCAFIAGVLILLLNSVLKLKTVFDLKARKIISSYKLFFFLDEDSSEIQFEREEFSMAQFDCIYVEPHVISGRGTAYLLKLSLYSEFDSLEKPKQKLMLTSLGISQSTFDLANKLSSFSGYTVFIPDICKEYINEHGRDSVYFS